MDSSETQLLYLDEGTVAYRQSGRSGTPLLFLHGWADSSVVWHRALETWGGRYRVIALDQPGHGGSTPTPVELGTEAIAARLAAAIAALGVQDNLTIVGHSFGGLLGMQLAMEHPEQVTRLVLVNPAWSRDLTIPPALLRYPALGSAAMQLLHLTRLPLTWVPATVTTRLDAQQQARLHRWQAFNHSTPIWLYHTMVMIHHADLLHQLETIRQPTLVIAGKRDRTVPPTQTRDLAARLPDARLVEIDAGHQAAEEKWPAFRTALDDFLG